jgi:hypothetical protein
MDAYFDLSAFRFTPPSVTVLEITLVFHSMAKVLCHCNSIRTTASKPVSGVRLASILELLRILSVLLSNREENILIYRVVYSYNAFWSLRVPIN